jgi:predicted acyltransferase
MSASATPTPLPSDLPPRLVSLDAYRGFIMLTMASGGLGLFRIFQNLELSVSLTGIWGQLASPGGVLGGLGWIAPGRVDAAPASPFWATLGFHFEHVEWAGCSFWDLIQPSFMFMVGVAMPFSLAARAARGDSFATQFFHAVWRAGLLILLAVFLSSPQTGFRGPTTQPLTNWIFPNVLAQIGLGYVFLFLLAGRGLLIQSLALGSIFIGYTALFALWPIPSGYDSTTVGVPATFPRYEGYFAAWNKNANAAHFIDVWFLNLFPRVEPFRYNAGGYQTLNFVPSLITMILGLMAGEMLRRPERSNAAKFVILVLASVVCLGLGSLAGEWVCPIVKRIWTPSWAVFSSGWTFLMLAFFFGIIDVLKLRGWEFPLVVVGMNSIAMYCMSQLMGGWVRSRWVMHLGSGTFAHPYGPLLLSLLGLATLWLICLWLYRRRIFLRI